MQKDEMKSSSVFFYSNKVFFMYLWTGTGIILEFVCNDEERTLTLENSDDMTNNRAAVIYKLIPFIAQCCSTFEKLDIIRVL